MNRPTPSFAELQAWMQHRLMHPHVKSEAGNWSCSELITRSRQLSPEQRMDVYVNAYVTRLVDCLRVEFPAVRHAAGDEAFDGFAAGYLLARPSQSVTLADLGREFSAYLQSTRPPPTAADVQPDFADFLIDLATLERTCSEVFDASGPEQDSGVLAEQLSQFEPERFASARLQFYDTVRLLSLRFPCHEYASSVRRGEEAIPPGPHETRLVVFRRGYVVRRMELAAGPFELLRSLQRGESVAAALRRTLETPAQSFTGADVQKLFATWAAAQFLRRILPGDGPLPGDI